MLAGAAPQADVPASSAASRPPTPRSRSRLGLRPPSRARVAPGNQPATVPLGASPAVPMNTEQSLLITPRRESRSPSTPSTTPSPRSAPKTPKETARPPRQKKNTTTWRAPQAGPEEPSKPSARVWRAPEPMKKPARKEKTVVRKETKKQVRRQDLEPAIFEELTEQEILVVLQALSTRSPEARQLLDDVLRRIDELRRFDTFRQI